MRASWKFILVLVVALAFIAMAMLHVPCVNGTRIWFWPWRTLPVSCWLIMLAGILPMGAAIAYLYRAPDTPAWRHLSLLMFGAAAIKAASLFAQWGPASPEYLQLIIRSDSATSYYFDAVALSKLNEPWLAEYPGLLPQLSLHSMTKPVGPLLFFYAFVTVLGDSTSTAIISGAALVLLSLLSIPATYAATLVATGRREAALASASVLACAPGWLLFATKFDPLWTALGAGMIATWLGALTARSSKRRGWCVAGFGALLALVLLVGFQLLAIGLFLLLATFAVRRADVAWPEHLSRVVRFGLIAVAMAIGAHVLLYAVTGYNTWETFRAVLDVQRTLLATFGRERVAPYTAPGDLYDFALAFGWIGAPLFLVALFNRSTPDIARRLGWCAAAFLVVLALSGLIACETARCWLFVAGAPLIVLGAELSTWPRRQRAISLGLMLAATLAIHANMAFLVYNAPVISPDGTVQAPSAADR